MNKRIFITNLINLRKANKFRQKEMAAILGVKLSTYKAYETGRNFPKTPIQLKIANEFQYNLVTMLTILIPNSIAA